MKTRSLQCHQIPEEQDEDGKVLRHHDANLDTNSGKDCIVIDDHRSRSSQDRSMGQETSTSDQALAQVARESEPSNVTEFKFQFGHPTTDYVFGSTSTVLRPTVPDVEQQEWKDVLLGHWVDTKVADVNKKHAVTGFLDSRGSLRMRIQPYTQEGQSLAPEHPSHGPHRRQVALEHVVLSDHLVGLDLSQLKDYVRTHSRTGTAETKERDAGAGESAIGEQPCRRKEVSFQNNSERVPAVIPEVEERQQPRSLISAPKRRKESHSFTPILPASTENPSWPLPLLTNSVTTDHSRIRPNSLPGSTLTSIYVGRWKKSVWCAVYGVLGQNKTFGFGVKENRANMPFTNDDLVSTSSMLWIPYEEVIPKLLLQNFNHQEVMQYCLVRQHQIDLGETPAETADNEIAAAHEVQLLAANISLRPSSSTNETLIKSSQVGLGSQNEAKVGSSEASMQASHVSGVEVAKTTSTEPVGGICLAGTYPSRTEHHPVHKERDGEAIKAHMCTKKHASQGAKIDDQVEYKRKATGPFKGNLVSRGTIVNVNGDDYIEYRVLAKASFL